MKKLLLLLFSLMISFNSYGDWKQIGTTSTDAPYYIDFEKIKSVDGYIYFWTLGDLLKPDKDGDLSYISYHQGDCKISRKKILSENYYKQPMGRGNAETHTIKNPIWEYPSLNSVGQDMLETACDFVK